MLITNFLFYLLQKLRSFEILLILMLVVYENTARPGGEWKTNNACNNGDVSIAVCAVYFFYDSLIKLKKKKRI